MQQYNINGKTYTNLKDLPAEFQNLFDDKNRNGIPDIMEGMVQNVQTTQGNNTINTVVYNHKGKSYNNFNELPPEAQKKIRDKFAKLPNSLQLHKDHDIANPYGHASLKNIVKEERGFSGKMLITLLIFFFMAMIILGIVYVFE